jgi:GNAT superfamily N-acetyltransferase
VGPGNDHLCGLTSVRAVRRRGVNRSSCGRYAPRRPVDGNAAIDRFALNAYLGFLTSADDNAGSPDCERHIHILMPGGREGAAMTNRPTETAGRAIRLFHESDQEEVVGVWHRSGIAAYTYLPTWQAFTLDQAAMVFDNVIRPNCAIWVGTVDERVVAYLAMNGSYIDRLYVDPSEWRKGWGAQLVAFAMQLSPAGLELHTHQANHAARALYERSGFRAVASGTSPPPESAPDVEYHWRP